MGLSAAMRQRAAAALAKRARGAALSREDERAIARVEKAHREAIAEEAYRAVPKKVWRKWSGRSAKQVAAAGQKHGLPLCGESIDLEALARAVHDALERRETKEHDDEIQVPRVLVGSLQSVAAYFGVARQTVTRGWKLQGMPCHPDGGYSLVDIAIWKDRRERGAADAGRGESSTRTDSFQDARHRKAVAEARDKELHSEERELKLAQLRGELVGREAVSRALAQHNAVARAMLEDLPQQIAKSVPRKMRNAVMAEASRVVRQALDALPARLETAIEGTVST